MKLSTILFSLGATATAVYADDFGAGTVKAAGTTTTASNSAPLDGLKQKTYGTEYHMPMVKVVHARVQSDKPILMQGRFVSSKAGAGSTIDEAYNAALDTVNTASVEGALMFVQAEGINVKGRGTSLRCERKNKMSVIVFYEILIAQTNETIAQFSSNWNAPEYGPMQPMDAGQCRPLHDDVFPPECLQYNGVNGQPNVGPFVGGGLKNNDVRAPYPDNYWFSFPNTCPLKTWADKNEACRKETRKGLCSVGQAPDGVDCTFAYDILGWVPIDDVVGITNFTDASGKPYKDFESWCKADPSHIEFSGDIRTGEMEQGIDFWKDPKNPEANRQRAGVVVQMYQDILSKKFTSQQITADELSHFKDLPDPDVLAKENPGCYNSVPGCNTGNGCQRLGFSQLCFKCQDKKANCKTDPTFTFPTLAKATTKLSEAEVTSIPNAELGANGNINGSTTTAAPTATPKGAASAVQVAVATLLVAFTAALST